MARILFVITEDWALVTHRLHLVKDAIVAGHQVGLLTRIGNYGPLFNQLGITVFDWKLTRRSMGLLNELRATLELLSTIKLFEPDLIHAVALKPVIYAGLVSRFTPPCAITFALGGAGICFQFPDFKSKVAPKSSDFISENFLGWKASMPNSSEP